MKKITLALIGVFCFTMAFSQSYTTGVMSFANNTGTPYTVQIDVDATTTTLTMTGPDLRWFGVGFGVQSMTSGGDVVIFDNTSVTDRYYGFEGQDPGQDATGITPTEDREGERDWTTVSNTLDVPSGVRTVVSTRLNNTGNPNDYVFSASATTLELVWALARFDNDPLVWHGNNRGITMQGLTLSNDTFEVNDFKISPNPAKNNFTLELGTFNNNAVVEIYDVLGKKVLNRKINAIVTTFDISKWNSGLYIIKISSETSVVMKRFMKQ
ncbi:T9SS type A sorting domain-containing protein [Psychroserpens sp. AS72]|uniref:T9SS type A sorting domain-containing protein n=1 Tax=Psychroserpens sp. AS72 TaxID=3135775 RepID=UPI00317F348A